MGLGNGNPKSGDKGSNFDYELKVLKLLEAIAVSFEGQGGSLSAACFIPTITVDDPDAQVVGAVGQYQRIRNIVTCTVSFRISSATSGVALINIDVPVKDISSDYTSSPGLIMGTITALEAPQNWRNLDFDSPFSNGITFLVRTVGGSILVNTEYVAQFSYAYNTNDCSF